MSGYPEWREDAISILDDEEMPVDKFVNLFQDKLREVPEDARNVFVSVGGWWQGAWFGIKFERPETDHERSSRVAFQRDAEEHELREFHRLKAKYGG